MTSQQAKKRIEKLKQEIEHHRYVYHVLDKQEISDAALDSLKDELVRLEEQYPQFLTPDSPSQRVAGKSLEKFVKVPHAVPMISLNDAFSREDLDAWVERLQRVDPRAKYTFYVEPKIDGLAISLIYEYGQLSVAATRGDGRTGEDVTHNIRTIESVPLRIDALAKRARVEVRGEVYLTTKAFNAINVQREKAGEPLYMNPRNTAAGSIRQLNPAMAASRDLQFLAYAVVTDLGQTNHHEEHELLHTWGFKTDPDARICKTLDDVWTFYEELGRKREKLPCQIDGVVIRVDQNAMFDRFGVVGKAPRGAIALKFPAEQSTTVVEDIQVQVGRTGALTPVAHLKPVRVAGSMVARATLHNMDEIKRLGIKIGDTVIIEKAGDIIPDIVQVLPKLRTGRERNFHMPKKCPLCASQVIKKEGEIAYYCTNTHCFGQQRERLHHFVSRKGLDIAGLGPKIIDQLIQTGLVSTPADLFELTVGDMEPLERFAEKSAQKMIDAIQARRSTTLPRLIYALGIRHVGEQTAATLADCFGTFDALQHATPEQLENIHDIGEVAAESIIHYFADKKNAAFLKQLLKHVHVERAKQQRSQKLSGKSFLFTGGLESMTRDDAKDLVRQNGGAISSSVNKQLDYLVVGDDPGSKLDKAEKLNITILTEQQFLQLLK